MRELLSGIGPADGGPAAAARSRYNSWPEGLLRSARRDLADKAASRLPDLQRWLARQPAEEDG